VLSFEKRVDLVAERAEKGERGIRSGGKNGLFEFEIEGRV